MCSAPPATLWLDASPLAPPWLDASFPPPVRVAPPPRIKGGRTPTTGFCTAPFFVVPPNEGGAVALSEAADVALAEELTAFTKEMRTQFKTPYLFELAKDDGASIECNNIRCGAKTRRGPCCKVLSIRRCPRCGAVGQSAGCGSCAACCAACCQ